MSFSSSIRFTETFYLPTLTTADSTPIIERELMSLTGMRRVTILLAGKRVICSYGASLTAEAIEAKMEAMGHVVAPSLATH